MGRISKETILLVFLFLAVLSTRLFFALQTQTLDSDSYFVVRQAEHIKETGIPLFRDDLSYSGRLYIFPPLFHYLVAAVAYFTTAILAAKIVSSICLAAIVFVVYAISKHITKNKNIALLAALFSGFVPGLYLGINSSGPTSLNALLIFLTIYCLIRLEEPGYAQMSIFLAVLSILTSTEIFFLVIGLFIYFIILFLEREEATRKETEFTIFLIFISVWFSILLYKRSFLYTGISTLWANIPPELISTYFQDLTFVKLLYYAGVIPLIIGVYAVYTVVFDTKNRFVKFFTALAISSFFALWLKLFPLNSGIIFFSLSIILLSSHGLKSGAVSLSRMKSKTISVILVGLMLAIFLITTIPYFVSIKMSEGQNIQDTSALKWISENTPNDAVVLGRVDEGFIINYYAKRKNVADQNFLFIRDSEKIYDDVEGVYRLRLLSETVRILDNYDVDYLFLSSKTKQELNLSEFHFIVPECFTKVYDEDATIYHFKGCTI